MSEYIPRKPPELLVEMNARLYIGCNDADICINIIKHNYRFLNKLELLANFK